MHISDVFFFSPLNYAILGYEMYTTMRADPCLCFVERCGRPNEQDINAEQQAVDPELGEGSVSNRADLYTCIMILQLIWLTGVFKLHFLFGFCVLEETTTSTLKIQNLSLRQGTLRKCMRRYVHFQSLNFFVPVYV